MVNCLVVGNESSRSGSSNPSTGAGIYIVGNPSAHAPVATIINCTIADNNSGEGAAGISVYHAPNGHPGNVVQNTIVWNSTSTSANEIFVGGTFAKLTADYCDVRNRTTQQNPLGSTQGVTWGTGNIGEDVTSHDPNFIGGGDYRLGCPSPCVNRGNPDSEIIPDNSFNLGGYGVQVPTPDLDVLPRIIERVDMGAYEKELPMCPADMTGDGQVGVPDLLAIINAWGPCPAPPAACPGDFLPSGGDGNVGVPELLNVINTWGPCSCRVTPVGGNDEIPEEVTDCMLICENEEDYGGCVTKCLCGIGYYNEECD